MSLKVAPPDQGGWAVIRTTGQSSAPFGIVPQDELISTHDTKKAAVNKARRVGRSGEQLLIWNQSQKRFEQSRVQ